MAKTSPPPERPALRRVTVTVELDEPYGVVSTTLRPLALVAAERHFAGTIPAMEGTLWAAWYQLTGAQGALADAELTFADFLEKLIAIDEAAADPSQATQPAPSPSSP